MSSSSEAAKALEEANYGRFEAAERLMQSAALSEGWRAALENAAWMAGLRASAPLGVEVQDDDPLALACAAHRVTRSRLLRGDAAFFRRPLPTDSAWASARRWAQVAHGERVDAAPPTEGGPDHAALVVEHAVLRALAALNEDQPEEAVALSRRASRMAHTEGMPQSTYLANVVLARVRRVSGHPWLASRILRGLAGVAPPAWHPWLAWEMAMASGHAPLSVDDATPAASLLRALDAARAGNEVGRDAALDEAHQRCRGIAFLARDLSTVRAATDVGHRPGGVLATFATGAAAEPPRGMVGLAGLDEEAPDVAVCVGPEMHARRLLWMAAPTFAACPPLLARPGRTETGLSVLAFAGADGLSEAELFRRAYGFAYERELHKGVLGVLVHRMRAWVGERAVVHRDGGHLRLTPRVRLVIPDPRCERPTESRVLVLLGRHGLTTAKEAASTLAISVRSAQAALQALVEDGALSRVRQGRRVGYLLEDTTFEEPTQA